MPGTSFFVASFELPILKIPNLESPKPKYIIATTYKQLVRKYDVSHFGHGHTVNTFINCLQYYHQLNEFFQVFKI